MTQDQFIKCLSAITNSEGAGYSFVKDFSEWIYANRVSLGVGYVITHWEIEGANGYNQEFTYYGGDVPVITTGINLSLFARMESIYESESSLSETISIKGFWKGGHIISIPIKGIGDNDLNVYGAIVLISMSTTIRIDSSQLTILHLLLNSIKPHTNSYKGLINAKAKLRIEEDDLDSSAFVYDIIGDSVDLLAEKASGSSDTGLRHYSLWEQFNTTSSPCEATKIFSRNTVAQVPHSPSNISVDGDSLHYLSKVLRICTDGKHEFPRIFFIALSEAKDSFTDADYFKKLGLNEGNGTVVVAVNRSSGGIQYGYISCYYVKDLPYSVFISHRVTYRFTELICSAINSKTALYNKITLHHLISIASINFRSRSGDFYGSASEAIAKNNNADTCLIFLPDQRGVFQCVSLDYPYKDRIGLVDWPRSISLTDSFRNILSSVAFDNGAGMGDYCNLNILVQSDSVRSAMMVASYDKEAKCVCLIILMDENHKPTSDSTYFNNVFTIDNFQQTVECGLLISLYRQLRESIDNKNTLLKKFRHEIPSCTDIIEHNTSKIIDIVNSRGIYRRNDLINHAKMVKMYNNRVHLLGSFFSTVDFDDSRFAFDAAVISFNLFMNSHIDLFRSEGCAKGVDIYFSCLNDDDDPIDDVEYFVSNYFMLSIENIINNAVRYAAPGTCVNIRAYPSRIDVIDVGIAVNDDEKEAIFLEGFRSQEAKGITADGMGYGLYLTKRIVSAHGASIEVDSIQVGKTNYYLMTAVLRYYDSLESVDKKNSFIYDSLEPSEYFTVNKILSSMREVADRHSDNIFLNNKPDVISEWINGVRNNNTVFIEYPEIFFDRPVHKVKFSIVDIPVGHETSYNY